MTDETSPPTREHVFLRLLADRAMLDPAYVGWALREYSEVEGEPMVQLISRLGVTDQRRDGLMTTLRPAGSRFAEMVGAIVEQFQLDELAFVSALRRVDVLGALRDGGPASADAGALVAARMRDATEEERPHGTGQASSDADDPIAVRRQPEVAEDTTSEDDPEHGER